ncbi:hypothetical protein PMAYCL1PPCAC_05289, partial [Pristionchus mayeri]
FQNCMRESIEGAQESLQIAYKEMNGWLSTSKDTRPIEDVLIGAYRTNALSMFHISAQIDSKDISSRTILTIEEATPFTGHISIYGAFESFHVDDLLSGRLDKHWLNSLLFNAGLELAKDLGMRADERMRRALAHAILLDYKITRCSPQFAAQTSKPEQWRTTLGELELYDSMFDFRFFLGSYLGRDIPADTEVVIAPGRDYFMRMMAVLQEYSAQEGQQIIRDYIKFKQLFMLTIHSGKLVRSRDLGGLETLRILYTGEDDRSLQCINRVGMVNQLGFVSILEKFWGTKLRENMEKARSIGEDMRREYIDALRKSDVIDEKDRFAMIDKTERVRIRVAVPEASRDPVAQESEYKMV